MSPRGRKPNSEKQLDQAGNEKTMTQQLITLLQKEIVLTAKVVKAQADLDNVKKAIADIIAAR